MNIEVDQFRLRCFMTRQVVVAVDVQPRKRGRPKASAASCSSPTEPIKKRPAAGWVVGVPRDSLVVENQASKPEFVVYEEATRTRWRCRCTNGKSVSFAWGDHLMAKCYIVVPLSKIKGLMGVGWIFTAFLLTNTCLSIGKLPAIDFNVFRTRLSKLSLF